MATRDMPADRPAYGAAAIAAAAVFGLYLYSLAPSTAMWDAGEYMAAAYGLSIPHQPGNSLFVLLGRTFSLLPIAPSVAMRINVLSALSGALAAGLWFLVTERLLRGWTTARWQRLVGASVATLVGATAFTVWNHSVVNEKVYTISLVGLALVVWLTLRWMDAEDTRSADRLLVLIAYLLGLGYTNHPAGMLPAPAIALAVVTLRPRTLFRWRLLAVCAAALVGGLTVFAFQPLRAPHHPPQNTNEPTGCRDRIAVSCTLSQTTYQRLKGNILREQFGGHDILERKAPFRTQLAMFWGYFKWQWMRDADENAGRLQILLAALFLSLGIAGGLVHRKRDPTTFRVFGPLMFLLTLALIYYLNFLPGWSQGQRMGLAVGETEVRDRDYFFLWTFSAWGVWVALALVAGWRQLAEQLAATRARRWSWVLASPLLALALIPLLGNWHDASRRGDRFTREWAADLLNSVEPYGILITNGDNDTFPLWYAQDVEGIRRDVTVAVVSLLNLDWYARQILRRPIHSYDAELGPDIYRGRTWPKPSGPPLAMTLEQADSVPSYVQITSPQIFRKDSLVAQIQPGYLSRDQILVLRFIRDSFPERPVYFSAAGYASALGLEPYIVQQGLAYKLAPGPVRPSRDMMLAAGAWLDVDRTRQLWDTVYRAPRALVERGRWVDRASVNVPMFYMATGAILAEALRRQGDTTHARAVIDTVRELGRASQLEGLFTDGS